MRVIVVEGREVELALGCIDALWDRRVQEGKVISELPFDRCGLAEGLRLKSGELVCVELGLLYSDLLWRSVGLAFIALGEVRRFKG